MKLRILVERPDVHRPGKFNELFRQTLEYDPNVIIPFNRLYEGLLLLFPYEDVVIHFIG